MAIRKVTKTGRKPRSLLRTREETDRMVGEVMRLMTSGQWVSGASHADMAFKHGVCEDTVKRWAVAASRVIRAAVMVDPEDIRARLVSTLENVVAAGMAGGELKAVVAAVAEQAKLLGLIVQKHDVQLSEEQAKARYREITGIEWSAAERGKA